AKWLGHTSGLKGILIGSYIGVILPGGPFIRMPIVASIYRAGAGAGPIIAMLIGRQMLGIHELIVWEIPFLGVGIPVARYIVSLLIPPFAGLAGVAVYRVIARTPQTASKSDDNVSNREQ
ncbi:permease, partial [Chloroflexota bacterium]